jgi:hypothetical protein
MIKACNTPSGDRLISNPPIYYLCLSWSVKPNYVTTFMLLGACLFSMLFTLVVFYSSFKHWFLEKQTPTTLKIHVICIFINWMKKHDIRGRRCDPEIFNVWNFSLYLHDNLVYTVQRRIQTSEEVLFKKKKTSEEVPIQIQDKKLSPDTNPKKKIKFRYNTSWYIKYIKFKGKNQ